MKVGCLILAMLVSHIATAKEWSVLLGTKKLEAECQGVLSPELQTVLLSENGALIGTAGRMSVIRFDSVQDAKESRGRENNCVRLGNYTHIYDDENELLSFTTTGRFDHISCIGNCPGLYFKTDEDRDIWVDAASVYDFLGVDEIIDRRWKLKGLVRYRAVFSEDPNMPKRYKEVLFIKSIKEIGDLEDANL